PRSDENARRLLPRVNMPAPLRRLATDLCLQANVAGLRGDILLQSTARTIAAWAGRAEVQADDVYLAAEFVLVHRAGMTPPPPPPAEAEAPQDEPDKPYSDDPKAQSEQWSNRRTLPPTSQNHVQDDGQKRQEPVGDPDSSPQTETPSETPASSPINAKDGRQSTFEVGTPFPVQRIYARKDRVYRKGSGRRSRTRTSNKQGRYVRATMERKNHDLALDATIRAAAPYQKAREKKGLAISIQESDLREKVREKRVGNLLVFVVDASGSMGAERRMVETKGAILSLLLDAYQKRDRVGLVAFRGKEAKVLLPPTNSVELAQKLLKDLPTGGRTPLAAGLIKGYDVISQYLKKDCDITPILILISDGNANVSCGEGPPLQEVMKIAQRLGEDSRVNYLVIDVEKKGLLSFGLSREIAARLGALYFSLEDLRAENLVASVQLGRSVFHDISAYGGMNN
ncbi:MAG: VWA domain-containing protein, partial [Firmicutes bacterium]|nr:VWA domain-containing protein [Bacillota bacterium]